MFSQGNHSQTNAVLSSEVQDQVLTKYYRAILMSHPFSGVPALPFNTITDPPVPKPRKEDIYPALAKLPSPKKHYQYYFTTPPASQEMTFPTSGMSTFLQGYFYLKSADWPGNKPRPLSSWTAEQLAQMPGYYIMPLELGMRDTIAKDMSLQAPDEKEVREQQRRWLDDAELEFYVQEWSRTGFQGGLNW
jgi:hypothetical protein